MTSLCRLAHPIVENTIAPGMTPADLICGRSPGAVIMAAVIVTVMALIALALAIGIAYELTRSTP